MCVVWAFGRSLASSRLGHASYLPGECRRARRETLILIISLLCARYSLPPPFLFYTGIKVTPSLLQHIATIGKENETNTTDKDASAVLSIGPGLPPVPNKLVARIQAGEFIDMAELLPDRLGVSTTPSRDDKQAAKQKHRQVTNILEWIQCFSIYVAVLTQKHPDRIQDLLGYQALIVEACMEYNSEAWLGYDRRFRQNAAATPGTVWAKIDPTLWNKAFTGQARAQRCQYCFSLTHKSDDCDWADTASSSQTPKLVAPMAPTKPAVTPRTTRICYAWNHSPDTVCPFPDCAYQHICLYCAKDNQVIHKDHKAIFCKRRRSASGQSSNAPGFRAHQAGPYRYQPY